MSELLQNTSSIVWLVLAVIVFVKLRKWDKLFTELYEELKESINAE